MQYENVLIELLSRIKELEVSNEILKEKVAAFETYISENVICNADENSDNVNSSNASYAKTTDEMIDLCYDYGKRIYQFSDIDISTAISEVSQKTNMNKGSASIYIYAVKSMLEGIVYKRGIKNKATEKYICNIKSDYGVVGLKNALSAIRKHIEYRQGCGQNADSIIRICEKYE